AGRNLPDKELRSVLLLSIEIDGPIISVGLCMSPCSSDYIFTLRFEGAWRIVSEDSKNSGYFCRLIWLAIEAISSSPSRHRCRRLLIFVRTLANNSKSRCLAVRNRFSLKKGTTLVHRSETARTQNR